MPPPNQQPPQGMQQGLPPQGMPQPSHQMPHQAQQGQMSEEEKMLLDFLKGLQTTIEQLTARVDVLEQKNHVES